MTEFKSSKSLIEAIKGFEACRLTSYKCPAGVWTIGIGHTKGVKAGQHITMAQAESLLRNDLLACENYVNKLGVCKTQGQFDALVDFCFNCGSDKLANSTLLRKILMKSPDGEIAKEFRRWVYSKGKKLAGLEKRREWEVHRWAE